MTSEDRCQQKLRCQNSISGCTLHWETIIASALHEMRKACYVSVLADEVTLRNF